MESQRCETCLSWCQTPKDTKPGCHLFPSYHGDVARERMFGPITPSPIAAAISWLIFSPSMLASGWCRQWEPREPNGEPVGGLAE